MHSTCYIINTLIFSVKTLSLEKKMAWSPWRQIIIILRCAKYMYNCILDFSVSLTISIIPSSEIPNMKKITNTYEPANVTCINTVLSPVVKYQRKWMSDGETETINQNLAFLEETYNIYDNMYSQLTFLSSQTETRWSDHDTQPQRGKRWQNEGRERTEEEKLTKRK